MKAQDKSAYIAYRISKSDETLSAAKELARSKFWNSCVNRLYYSSFYAVNALLLNDGVISKSHAGIPVEFKSRKYLELHPVTGMTGNGTYNQHSGTWSDDSLLIYCLAEAIAERYILERTVWKFIGWSNEGYW